MVRQVCLKVPVFIGLQAGLVCLLEPLCCSRDAQRFAAHILRRICFHAIALRQASQFGHIAASSRKIMPLQAMFLPEDMQ